MARNERGTPKACHSHTHRPGNACTGTQKGWTWNQINRITRINFGCLSIEFKRYEITSWWGSYHQPWLASTPPPPPPPNRIKSFLLLSLLLFFGVHRRTNHHFFPFFALALCKQFTYVQHRQINLCSSLLWHSEMFTKKTAVYIFFLFCFSFLIWLRFQSRWFLIFRVFFFNASQPLIFVHPPVLPHRTLQFLSYSSLSLFYYTQSKST